METRTKFTEKPLLTKSTAAAILLWRVERIRYFEDIDRWNASVAGSLRVPLPLIRDAFILMCCSLL